MQGWKPLMLMHLFFYSCAWTIIVAAKHYNILGLYFAAAFCFGWNEALLRFDSIKFYQPP